MSNTEMKFRGERVGKRGMFGFWYLNLKHKRPVKMILSNSMHNLCRFLLRIFFPVLIVTRTALGDIFTFENNSFQLNFIVIYNVITMLSLCLLFLGLFLDIRVDKRKC